MLGRSEEALPKTEAALEICQRLFTGDHSEVARSLNIAARCLDSLGRSAEALPNCEAALAMSRRVLPSGRPRTLYPQIELARRLMKLGRHAEAEPLLRDAAEQCERSDASRQLHWKSVLEQSVQLYDAWHAAGPGQGYDTKAAQWRAKLAEWQASTQPGAPRQGRSESRRSFPAIASQPLEDPDGGAGCAWLATRVRLRPGRLKNGLPRPPAAAR